MDMTIDQQVELDEALVPYAIRLRIGKSNFRLRSDITSKESTLQLVYDVLRLTPFYKAFLVTADVPEIYMQEFWATAMVHHHSICFKMDNKKRIVNLEYFREMMHICLRLPGSDSWGLYHKKNVNFAYLLWEDFVYQVEYKDAKKSNEMYYLRFMKVIIHYFMTKDPLISRRNKVNWHYVIDDQMFITIKLVAMTEAEQLKLATKKSLQQTYISQASGSGVDEGTGIKLGVLDVPTEESDEEISWKSSDEDDDDVDEGSDDQDGDDDDQDEGDDDDDQDEGNDDNQDTHEEGEEFIHPKLSIHDEEETIDEESFDPIAKTPEYSDDKGNDDENLGLNVGSEEGQDAEDDEDELYRDVNINLEGRVVQMADVHTT
nr:hypothetical protein [Tanacetum cinerariifolium]